LAHGAIVDRKTVIMSIPIISSRTTPLPPDVSTAPRLLGATITVLVLGLLLFSARIITRVRPAPNLGWDDYTMTVAVVNSPIIPCAKN
jgi:hypothetical protein